VDEREYCSVTVAADPAKIKKLKEMIREFKLKVTRELEQGRPKEVYTFAMQLFPVTLNGGNSK
jgi:hypothetical protein